jgi:hypothetical protein
MMFVTILIAEPLRGAALPVAQGLVCNAADSHSQSLTARSLLARNNLMAPAVSAPLPGRVFSGPAGDLRIGLPSSFCAALPLRGALVAEWHFRRTASIPVMAYPA